MIIVYDNNNNNLLIYIYIYIYYTYIIYIYILYYIYIYILCIFLIYISINGKQINYKYIIAANSFMCVITIFRLYNMEENCLMFYFYDR